MTKLVSKLVLPGIWLIVCGCSAEKSPPAKPQNTPVEKNTAKEKPAPKPEDLLGFSCAVALRGVLRDVFGGSPHTCVLHVGKGGLGTGSELTCQSLEPGFISPMTEKGVGSEDIAEGRSSSFSWSWCRPSEVDNIVFCHGELKFERKVFGSTRELKLEKGATAVIFFPYDATPEYAFAFCILPEKEKPPDRAEGARKAPSKPGESGALLLELAIDLRDGKPLHGPMLLDLNEWPSRELGQQRGHREYKGEGSVTVKEAARLEEEYWRKNWKSWACSVERADEGWLRAKANMEFAGQKYETGDELRIEKGRTTFLVLRDEKTWRLLFIFAILPEPEGHENGKETREVKQ